MPTTDCYELVVEFGRDDGRLTRIICRGVPPLKLGQDQRSLPESFAGERVQDGNG